MVLLERRDGARLGPALSGVFFVFREVFMSAPQHITVVDYNPAWPELFAAERDLIAPVLGAQLLECYHIGSTAVPGLAAKPIIDLMVVVRDVAKVDALAAQFESLGYEYMGEFGIAGRRYLRKGGAERTHQIHIFDLKSEHHIVRHLALRDYLRARPAACAAYAELKRQLAAQFPYDIAGYCDGKDALVQELERQALAWYDASWERLYLQARAVQNPRTIGAFVEAGQVVAAFLTRSGVIFTGVCLDTACSLGICAERNAIGSMLTAGESDMTRLVVVMPGGALGLPCGACRELMMQLDANELEILTGREPVHTVTLSALVPQWWGS